MNKRKLLLTATLLLSGCADIDSRQPPLQLWNDMRRQAKLRPQAEKRAAVAGTVAQELKAIQDGRRDSVRGRERFEIYCSPCHDRAGTGRGAVATRAGWRVANLHEERIVHMADNALYQLVSNGQRTMPACRFQLSERDRGDVIAYLRALQRTGGR